MVQTVKLPNSNLRSSNVKIQCEYGPLSNYNDLWLQNYNRILDIIKKGNEMTSSDFLWCYKQIELHSQNRLNMEFSKHIHLLKFKLQKK